ncbi:MAG: hypothetical protein A2X61_01615 [Ignavibacteria bacterium GWB2_35_12]|nr:MAG: hypothetical protein A2X63_05235 [Ignavibacteria bacterium GWA2_35_8]OGU41869.1 MAG: hypothetical protein A2X61_01615 [Ignavibacteria bacterium GWB2_35_12]OGU86162.1 MAG: hypothetical protein A2220_17345 [Ignavibacteria bacterium RIFOXYA2_FULL_35_10]OGV23483.1 MAG: hypothetical protein A2475_06030 [Ignavibacteria bacterium RIFOXYC2_FULL_35_21]
MKKLFILSFLFLFLSFISSYSQWVQIGKLGDYSVDALAISGNNIFAGIQGGGIFLTTNLGANWKEINNGITDSYIIINTIAINGNNIFVGTYHNTFFSSDNGNNWNLVNQGIVYTIVSNGKNIFAGTSGGIFISTDNGVEWIKKNFIDISIYSLTNNGNLIFAGTSSDGVYLSTDNGDNWETINQGLPDPPQSIYTLTTSGNNVFAGLYLGGVFFSSDNGSNWKVKNKGLDDWFVSNLISIGNNVFARISSGVSLSTDNGDNWRTINKGFIYPAVTSFAINNTYIFAGTSDGYVYKANLNDFGITILEPFPPTNLTISINDGVGLKLQWGASSTPNVTYNIYRSLARGSYDYSKSIAKEINALEYTDNNVINGKRYYYVVRAYDPVSKQESDNSNEVSGIPIINNGWTDIHISLSVDKNSVIEQSGDTIFYIIDYSNRGNIPAENFEFVASIPKNTEYIDGSAIITGDNTKLLFTESYNPYDNNASWTETQPSVSQITGLKWSIPIKDVDCRYCDSRVYYKVKLLNTAEAGDKIENHVEANTKWEYIKKAPVYVRVIENPGLAIESIDYTPKPLVFGEPFHITVTIKNYGMNKSQAYNNLLLKISNKYNKQDTYEYYLMAISEWLDNNTNMQKISIPEINPGQSFQLTINNVQFISYGVILNEFETIGPKRILRIELDNHFTVSDKTQNIYLVNNIDQVVDIYPNSNEKMRCAMAILTIATIGLSEATLTSAELALKSYICYLNLTLGAKSLIDAANKRDDQLMANAVVKTTLSVMNCAGEASSIIFKRIFALWDGTLGCAKELFYNFLYIGYGAQEFWDRVSIFSPVFLSVKNGQNYITGFLPDSSTIADIPLSFFNKDSLTNEANVIFPHSDTLDFQLYGFDNGPYTFIAGITLDNSKLLKVTFKDTSKVGMYAYYHYRKGTNKYELEVDYNGDEKIDTTLQGTVEIIDTLTSVEDFNYSVNAKSNILKVYPNPFNDRTTIEFNNQFESNISLIITDQLGSEVYRIIENKLLNYGIQRIDFDSKGLSTGIYFLSLKTANYNETVKFIIIK